MNGFEQIKSFYSWVFNNPDKVRPTHVSLYLFIWNQANRANWAEWIKCPYDLVIRGSCIGNNGTYYRCLDDLQKFGLIEYQPGLNNYKAPLIKLVRLYDIEQLTEQVSVPLSEQVTVQQTEQLTVQLPVHIYKLITNNLKPITDNYTRFEKYVNNLSKSTTSKREKKVFVPPTIEEVKKYFIENGYKEDVGEKVFKYYNEADWVDGHGNKVRNWKQKMQAVWFKEENRIPKPKWNGVLA